jgi:hypothetical protein
MCIYIYTDIINMFCACTHIVGQPKDSNHKCTTFMGMCLIIYPQETDNLTNNQGEVCYPLVYKRLHSKLETHHL